MIPVPNAERVKLLKALLPFLDLTNLSASLTAALPSATTVARALLSGLTLTPFVTMELLAPPATNGASLIAATASTVGALTVNAPFLATGTNELAARARNVNFVTAGTTPAQCYTQAVVTGTDVNGNAQTETIAIGSTAGTYSGAKAFATVTSIAYTGGTGTAATISAGFGSIFGLSMGPLKARAGVANVVREVANGAVVTTGTYVLPATSGPNGTYSPATAPNGAINYAVTYELVVP